MIERFLLSLWHLLIGWGGLIVGGIYGAIRGFDELLKVMDRLQFRFKDYPVFEIIDKPSPSPPGLELDGDARNYYLQQRYRYGYSPELISKMLNRSEASVTKSLKRLKKADKATETTVGWLSSRTAPKE